MIHSIWYDVDDMVCGGDVTYPLCFMDMHWYGMHNDIDHVMMIGYGMHPSCNVAYIGILQLSIIVLNFKQSSIH